MSVSSKGRTAVVECLALKALARAVVGNVGGRDIRSAHH